LAHDIISSDSKFSVKVPLERVEQDIESELRTLNRRLDDIKGGPRKLDHLVKANVDIFKD
jgi:hypothetical protein